MRKHDGGEAMTLEDMEPFVVVDRLLTEEQRA